MIVISTCKKTAEKDKYTFSISLDGNTVSVESVCVSDLLSHMKYIGLDRQKKFLHVVTFFYPSILKCVCMTSAKFRPGHEKLKK